MQTSAAKTHGEYYALQLQDIRWAKASKNSAGDERVVRMMQDLIAAVCFLNLNRESANTYEKVGEDIEYEDGMVKDLEAHRVLGAPNVQAALEQIVDALPVGAKRPRRDVGQVLKENFDTAYNALHEAVRGAPIDIKDVESSAQHAATGRSEYAFSGTSLPSSGPPAKHTERSPYAFEGTSLPSGPPPKHSKRSEYGFEGTSLPGSS
jgi:hypothetical protein